VSERKQPAEYKKGTLNNEEIGDSLNGREKKSKKEKTGAKLETTEEAM